VKLLHARGQRDEAGYLDDPRPPPTGALGRRLAAARVTSAVARYDAGNLKIVGRSKDMFIVGGFNAYPAEIENALLRHPDIAQAAVIGIPDERMGEVGMAFVVTTSGATSIPDFTAWCREQMANYKVPRAITVVDQLPINATGKVMKDVLRESEPPTSRTRPLREHRGQRWYVYLRRPSGG
jgi:acyl-CoA synthetase (AMP-forming)/AMP-acid ligase II